MINSQLEKKSIERNNIIKTFLNYFTILFGCRSIGIVITILITILNGRVLTVEDMGQFNLSMNLSNILVIPLVFGTNTSLLKILSDEQEKYRGTIVGTVLICNGVTCLVGGILFASLVSIGEQILNLSNTYWYLAIIIAITCNLAIVIETFLKNQQEFKLIGTGKLISSFILLTAYIISIYCLKITDLRLFLIFNVISQLFLVFIMIVKVKFGQLHFSFKVAKEIYSISLLYMLSWFLSTFLYNADIYILAYITNNYEVGVYSAYQVNVRNYFSIFYHDIFAAVFLPVILSSSINKEELYRKIYKWIPAIVIVITLGTGFVCSLLILSYGRQYEWNFLYVALVSTGIGIQSIFFLFNSVLVLEGIEGAKISLVIMSQTIILLITNIFLLTYLFGKVGTMIAFPLNQLILVILLLCKTKKYRRGGENGY